MCSKEFVEKAYFYVNRGLNYGELLIFDDFLEVILVINCGMYFVYILGNFEKGGKANFEFLFKVGWDKYGFLFSLCCTGLS